MLVSCWEATSAHAAPAGALLERARAQFVRGEYQRVIDTLTPELYPTAKITDIEELKEAHYLIGSAHFFLKHRDLSRQEFVALLFLDPQRELNRAVDEPLMVEFFKSIKDELHDKLEELTRQKAIDERERNRRNATIEITIERTIREPGSTIGNFVPFGYGQFRNGDKGKGTFFLVSEAVTGGLSLSLFTYQAVTYGIPSRYETSSDADLLNTIHIVQVISGSLFLALYGVGVYDSFANQKPLIEEKRTERPIAPNNPTSLRIVPVLAPDRLGVGAEWSF